MPKCGFCKWITDISAPPWTDDSEWVPLTVKPMCFTSFGHYVGIDAASPSDQVNSFPQFSALPIEIQFRVLNFCPANTLFQIMHVSSTLRAEAMKLFWANPDVYFYALVDRLLGRNPLPEDCSGPDFRVHVQNVQFTFDFGRRGSRLCGYDLDEETRPGKYAAFWSEFKRMFPSVKRILVDYDDPMMSIEERGPLFGPLQRLIADCHLDVIFHVCLRCKDLEKALVEADIIPLPSWNIRQRESFRVTADCIWVETEPFQYLTPIYMPCRSSYPMGSSSSAKRTDLHPVQWPCWSCSSLLRRRAAFWVEIDKFRHDSRLSPHETLSTNMKGPMIQQTINAHSRGVHLHNVHSYHTGISPDNTKLYLRNPQWVYES